MNSPPAILFTDWDGTVTLQDSNDMLTDDLGMGHPARMKLNDKIIDGSLTFREAFFQMLDSVASNGYTLERCIDYLLGKVQLDPGFEKTVQWCGSKGIPVIVVSSGMDKVIDALLSKIIDPKLHSFIQVYANHVNVGDSWEILYRDDSGFGHDKHQSIETVVEQYFGGFENENRGKLFYSGDGVSDVSAARSCDLLFAKSGHDLVNICIRDKINYIEFNTFDDILDEIKKELNL